jgi:hypothetical protein
MGFFLVAIPPAEYICLMSHKKWEIAWEKMFSAQYLLSEALGCECKEVEQYISDVRVQKIHGPLIDEYNKAVIEVDRAWAAYEDNLWKSIYYGPEAWGYRIALDSDIKNLEGRKAAQCFEHQ